MTTAAEKRGGEATSIIESKEEEEEERKGISEVVVEQGHQPQQPQLPLQLKGKKARWFGWGRFSRHIVL